ncbi:hypothetical protein LY78DRAFT_485162 [Colletotrichum sublineola]|nr:hypothetical protein LY78DRAFT_485162 [Colletotrichum sublineola]
MLSLMWVRVVLTVFAVHTFLMVAKALIFEALANVSFLWVCLMTADGGPMWYSKIR